MTIDETIHLLETMKKVLGGAAAVRIADPENPEYQSKELIRWRAHPKRGDTLL